MARTRVNVFEALIIKSATSPTGSAGVRQWIDQVAAETMLAAMSMAPVGRSGDRVIPPDAETPRDPQTGTYRRSFGITSTGTNQHKQRRRLYNTARHAGVIEHGRWTTVGWSEGESYHSADDSPKRFRVTKGTSGRAGQHVMARALDVALEKVGRKYAVESFSKSMDVDIDFSED